MYNVGLYGGSRLHTKLIVWKICNMPSIVSAFSRTKKYLYTIQYTR